MAATQLTSPPDKVAAAFAKFPSAAHDPAMDIRAMLLAVAGESAEIGPISETLKWGEPAYLTEATGSGTTIRLAWKEKRPDRIGIYVHCQTNIIETLREMLPSETEFEGNRAMLLDIAKPLPVDAVRIALRMALTYHASKRG